MNDKDSQSDAVKLSDSSSTASRFWALPWWGWTVALFGGVILLGGLANAIQVVYGEPADSDPLAVLMGLTMLLVTLFMLFCSGIAVLKLMLSKLIGLDLPPSSRKPWMAIGGGLFVCGIAMSIVPLLYVSSKTAGQTPDKSPDVQLMRYDDPEGNFSVEAPDTWQSLDDPTLPPSGLFLSDRMIDLHLVATAAPHEDIVHDSAEDFLRIWAASVANDMTSPAAGDVMTRQVGSQSVADTTIEGGMNGVNLVFRLRIIKTETHWIDVRAWTTKSRFKDNSPLLEQILSSVQGSS